MISTYDGLENLFFFNKNGLINWYLGEIFFSNIENYNNIIKFDILQFINSPFNSFGDMFIQPYLSTPHDDHNWTIINYLEKLYFNNVKLSKSQSDLNTGDTSKFWPIERNLHTFFGEFLEYDLYYGWSHSVLIDTQTYFDYSPYSLTNIFGDGLVKHLLTDIFSIFIGPSELDESNYLNLKDWGSNYSAGSTSNRISGGETSGLELSSSLNKEQIIRENGETFHEWFPGFYVLDGRLESRFSIFFLRITVFFLIPISIYSFWTTVNGKTSNYFDETFGEVDMTNFNFYFFGNEQTETFSTYFWNPIFNSSFEWPMDNYSNDPVANEPTSNLFEDIFKNFQSGLFNHTLLDSFFFLFQF